MKSVVMIGGGVQEVPAVQRIQKLGYKVIVTDRNPDAPAFADADVPLNIDARDIQGLIAWILLNKANLRISGIFTLISQAPSVALVANATGLPSLPVKTVMCCDNKLLMKRQFKENEIPTAEFFEVSSLEEVRSCYRKFDNQNVYLKAPDGFGGRGIRKITHIQELDGAYQSILKTTKFPLLILEESLEGSFIDAQGIFYDGNFHRAGVADSFFSDEMEEFKDYNPVEVFNVSPSQQSEEIINDVYLLLERVARDFGINWGPVAGDFILTDDGLKIIEIAPRLHGPNGTLQIFPASIGIKPLEFMVQCIAGDEPEKDFLRPKLNKVALCKVFISNKENIRRIGFKADLRGIEGLFSWFIYNKPDEGRLRSMSNLSGLASVFVEGQNYEQALGRLTSIEDLFEIN
jgi:biotin carboxylase